MNRFKALRYFAYTLEALVVFMIQETPGLLPEVFHARPILLIPMAVSIAMFESPVASMFFGVLCGLLIDFGIGSILGFHAFLLAVFCFNISVLAADLVKTNFLTSLLVLFITGSVILLFQWFFYFVLYGYAYSGYALWAHYLPRLLYSMVSMPIIYYFNRALALQIREKA